MSSLSSRTGKVLRRACAVVFASTSGAGAMRPVAPKIPPTPDFGKSASSIQIDSQDADSQENRESLAENSQAELLSELEALEKRVRESSGDMAKNRSWLVKEGVSKAAVEQFTREGMVYRRDLDMQQRDAERLRDKLEEVEGFGGMSSATERRFGKIFKILGSWKSEEAFFENYKEESSSDNAALSLSNSGGSASAESEEPHVRESGFVAPRASPASSVSGYSDVSRPALVRDMDELVVDYRDFFARLNSSCDPEQAQSERLTQLSHENGELKHALHSSQTENDELRAQHLRLLGVKKQLENEFGAVRGENMKMAGSIEELRRELEMLGRENAELREGRQGADERGAEEMVLLERERVKLMDELIAEKNKTARALEARGLLSGMIERERSAMERELAVERATFEAEKESHSLQMRKQMDRLEVERQILAGERSATEVAMQQLRTEREKNVGILGTAEQALSSEKAFLEEEKKRILEESRQLCKQKESLQLTKQKLALQARELEERSVILQDQNRSLREQLSSVEKQKADLEMEKSRMERELLRVEMGVTAVEGEAAQLRTDNARLSETLKRRNAHLSLEKTAAEAEAADLREQLAVPEKHAKAVLGAASSRKAERGEQQLKMPVSTAEAVRSPIRRSKSSTTLLAPFKEKSQVFGAEALAVAPRNPSNSRDAAVGTGESQTGKGRLVLEYSDSRASSDDTLIPAGVQYTGPALPVRMPAHTSHSSCGIDAWLGHQKQWTMTRSKSSSGITSVRRSSIGAGRLPDPGAASSHGRGPLPVEK